MERWWQLHSDRTITALLGWVAGYADTAGFLGLNGLFTAHVTGNLIVAGAEVVGVSEDTVWVRLAVVPVFIVAVALTTVLVRQRHLSLSHLLWLEAATLLLFLIVGIGVVPNPGQTPSTAAMFITGSAGVFAMGIQNGLMREALGTLAPTTVMTGNLTQLVIDGVQLSFLQRNHDLDDYRDRRRELVTRIKKFGSALLGFVVGAVAGAFFMRWFGFWSILLPALAIAFLAINTHQPKTTL